MPSSHGYAINDRWPFDSSFIVLVLCSRTRLQVQYKNDVYSGTFDAFKKILKTEGVGGLYRGFWVSAFQV